MIRNFLSKCVGFVGRIAYAGCVLDVFTNYVAEPTVCIGQSMRPTINLTSRNNIVLTEHLSNRLQCLKKNDIVIARSPQDPCVSICKRITGMEGDFIHTAEQKTIKVPKGHVWLTGDNCDNSVDSRTYGSVPCGLILGKVCYKLYPFSEFGPVN